LKRRVPSTISVLAIIAGTLFVCAPAVQTLAQGLSIPPPRAAFPHLAMGVAAPDFALKDINGKTRRLRDYRGKVVLLEWTSPVCPFTHMKYRNFAMQKLQTQAAARGIVWLTINTSGPGKAGYLTPKTARERLAKTQSKPAAFLFDDGTVGRLYGARTTPSAYIIGKDGVLLYQGAVDDDQLARGEITHDYIHEAFEDIRKGRPITTPETRPYGCAVEY
jgi:hypothetical protein